MITTAFRKTLRHSLSNLTRVSAIGLAAIEFASGVASGQLIDPTGQNRCWSNALGNWVDLSFFDGETCHYLCGVPLLLTGGSPSDLTLAGGSQSCPYGKSESGGCYATLPGLARWSVDEPIINLRLDDTPLHYSASRGRPVRLALSYKNMIGPQGTNDNREPRIFSVGHNWYSLWRAYLEAVPSEPTNYWVYLGNGAARKCTVGKVDYLSFGKLTQVGGTNLLEGPDGSIFRFGLTTMLGGVARHFLTSKEDSIGNGTRFTYLVTNDTIRLETITDVDNRPITFEYAPAGVYSNVITKIIAPHGLTNILQYDSSGRLTNITDAIGLRSQMVYNGTNLTALITPYGTNTFTYFSTSNQIFALRISEHGIKNQFYLYSSQADAGKISADLSAYLPGTTNASVFAIANAFDYQTGDKRNSFHWGPRQYEILSDVVRTNLDNGTFQMTNVSSGDYLKARMSHWLKDSASEGPSLVLSFHREASPDGVTPGQIRWFDYDGKAPGFSEVEGTNRAPRLMARKLANGETRLKYAQRNVLGHPTLLAESYTGEGNVCMLRTNLYEYAPNHIDLTRHVQLFGALTKQVSSNVFNAGHRVVTNVNALNEKTAFTYNSKQQLLSSTMPGGLTTTNIYYSSGNWSNFLAQRIDIEIARTNSMSYSNGYIFTHTDPLGHTRTHFWDALGRRTKSVNMDGTSLIWTYSNLNVVAITNQLGHWKRYGYNSFKQKVSRVDARSTNSFSYCSCGTLDTTTDPFGNTTRYIYDNSGRRRMSLWPGGYAVTNNLDLMGQVTNVIDSAGHSITNWFNNQGMICIASNAFGCQQMNKYDLNDLVIQSIDANNVMTSVAYDDLGRRTFITNGLGTIASFRYSSLGLVAQTNQMTNYICYGYDVGGRRIAETNANGEVTQWKCDASGNVTNLIDANGNNTHWKYDHYGRITNKTDALGNVTLKYSYDCTGRLTNRWTPEKGNTGYSYDASGNLTNIDYASSPDIAMEFDANNRVVLIVDAIGTTRYTYTDLGTVLSEDGPWVDDTVSYSYTSNRLRNKLTLLQANAGTWIQNYSYDDANRLQSIVSPAGEFNYSYDLVHPLQLRRLSLPGGSCITNAFDSLARMTSTTLKNSGGSLLNSHVYSYDDANRRTRQTRTAGDYVDYGYDAIGQLSSAVGLEYGGATNRWHERFFYIYDQAGNLSNCVQNVQTNVFRLDVLNQLISVVRTNASTTLAGITTSTATNVTVSLNGGGAQSAERYADATFARTNVSLLDGTNTFTAIARDSAGRSDTNSVTAHLPSTITFIYDLNGNLRTNGSRIFEYDDENQLTRIIEPGAWKSEFTYDGNMRRRVRKEWIWQNGAWLNTTEVRYVYDHKLVLQERDALNVGKVSYTRGNDISGSLEGAGGIGGLLARTEHGLARSLTGASTLYHCDGNGNVTCLIDTNNSITARYIYDPFGSTLSAMGPMAEVNLNRFSSKELHARSGIVYYLYRYYDAHLQRWLNKDPLGEIGFGTLRNYEADEVDPIAGDYRFVNNEPISHVDPHGLEGWFDPWFGLPKAEFPVPFLVFNLNRPGPGGCIELAHCIVLVPFNRIFGPRDQVGFGKCMGFARNMWNAGILSFPANDPVLRRACKKAQSCYDRYW